MDKRELQDGLKNGIAMIRSMDMTKPSWTVDTSWIASTMPEVKTIQEAHANIQRMIDTNTPHKSFELVNSAIAMTGVAEDAAASAIRAIELAGISYENFLKTADLTAAAMLGTLDPARVSRRVLEMVGVQKSIDAIAKSTMSMFQSSIISEVLENADSLRQEFGGSQVEEFAEKLLADELLAHTVDESVAFFNISDPKNKAFIAWFIGIVVGLFVLSIMLGLHEATKSYSELLSVLGLTVPVPTAISTGKWTGKKVRQGLDKGFPTQDLDESDGRAG